MILFIFYTIVSLSFFYLFIRNREHNPLWLMFSAWMLALGIPRLHLSTLESAWPFTFWVLVLASIICFGLGFYATDKYWYKHQWWRRFNILTSNVISEKRVRYIIYCSFFLSLIALYLFYQKAGNFPLLAADSDAFRFAADDKVPGLINYLAQLARLFIPISFFLIFYQGFNFKKHWDLIIISLLGTAALTVFASRTQIFFIDLWIMALYLIIRKPNIKQALRFYPVFLVISLAVLSAVPMIRAYKSYGTTNYLAGITAIDSTEYNVLQKAFIPIYVGVSFNMQALFHAEQYYLIHPLQHGRVTLDPFTNIFGKAIPALNHLKSHYDLGAIFYSWWNTGTYLFPFVQDFGVSAFFIIPMLAAALISLAWHYWKSNPNYLSINLFAYTCFFIVMTIYLSFTVRAEMYLDLLFLFITHLYVSRSKVY